MRLTQRYERFTGHLEPMMSEGSDGTEWPLVIGLAAAALLAMTRSQASATPPFARVEQSPHMGPTRSVWPALALVGGSIAAVAAYRWLDSPIGMWRPSIPAPPTLWQEQPAMGRSALVETLQALPVADSTATQPLQPPFEQPSDFMWLRLVRHPSVVLIIGRRGAGKSGLGYRLLELLRGHGEPYVVGLPAAAEQLLPDWVGIMDSLEEVPQKAIVLLDESYLHYHSRASMASESRSIGSLINLSRQRQQTLIFVIQEARQLDVNIVSQIDVLAVKELSDLSQGFERPQLRRLTDKARASF